MWYDAAGHTLIDDDAACYVSMQVDSGKSLSYEFYDQAVSWEVQTVSHILAAHDRLSVFTPTFARRPVSFNPATNTFSPKGKPVQYEAVDFSLTELWFPGGLLETYFYLVSGWPWLCSSNEHLRRLCRGLACSECWQCLRSVWKRSRLHAHCLCNAINVSPCRTCAGSHYDCGRQHFRFGRIGGPPWYFIPVPWFLRLLVWPQRLPELLLNMINYLSVIAIRQRSEVVFDAVIADAAFNYVVKSVKEANAADGDTLDTHSELLPQPSINGHSPYLIWAQDPQWTWHMLLPWYRRYGRDAYDHVADSALVDGLSNLPGGDVLPFVLSKQVRSCIQFLV